VVGAGGGEGARRRRCVHLLQGRERRHVGRVEREEEELLQQRRRRMRQEEEDEEGEVRPLS